MGEMTRMQSAAISRALADPRRFAMLEQISSAGGALPCCSLDETKRVSAATISHHIGELEGAGLIAIQRQGKFANLVFRRDVYNAYLAYLAAI